MIYQKLTGKRGIFSTRIAYVLVEGDGLNKKYLLEVADADGFNPRPIMIPMNPLCHLTGLQMEEYCLCIL